MPKKLSFLFLYLAVLSYDFCLEELKDFNKLHDSNYRSFCITGDKESNIKYILIMEHPRSRDGNDETIKKINLQAVNITPQTLVRADKNQFIQFEAVFEQKC